MCEGRRRSARLSTAPVDTSTSTMTIKSSRLSISSSSTSSFGTSVMPRESVSGRWVEDAACKSCTKCDRSFTVMNRRHHCRICGNIFCHACSRTRMVLATRPDRSPKRQRVCDNCAAHARTSAVFYDDEDLGNLRNGSVSSTSSASTEVLVGTETDVVMLEESSTTTITTTTASDPSASFMWASMACFAAAFWFLKDEVSSSNPAIWILCVGFLKNLHDLVVIVRRQRKHKRKQHFSRVADSAMLEKPSDASTADSDGSDSSSDLIELSTAQQSKILENAKKAVDRVWHLGMEDTKWVSEPSTMDDVVLFSQDHKPVRIFKCEATIDLSPDALFHELHGQFEQSSVWNVTAAENKILKTLDDTTDLVHLITAPALGGMVTSRDFVNTRQWRRVEHGGYVIGSTCAGKNLVPTAKGITRGVNGPTGFIILPVENARDQSRLIWVMDCDIKGYFPSSVIRKGTLSEMCCFVRNLRRHLAATKGQ